MTNGNAGATALLGTDGFEVLAMTGGQVPDLDPCPSVAHGPGATRLTAHRLWPGLDRNEDLAGLLGLHASGSDACPRLPGLRSRRDQPARAVPEPAEGA